MNTSGVQDRTEVTTDKKNPLASQCKLFGLIILYTLEGGEKSTAAGQNFPV